MIRTKSRNNKLGPKIIRRTGLSYYRSGRPSAKSPFQRSPQSKRRGFLSKIFDWLMVMAVLGGIVYSLMLRPDPSLSLSSTAYHPADQYDSAVESALKSLKNRNKLTFDEDGLSATIKKRFPEISNLSADLPLFGQTATIHISIAKPGLILRGAEGTFGAANPSVIDSKGTVVGPLPDFPEVKNLPLITDETGFQARPGSSFLSLSDVNFILTMVAQAKKAKVPITSLVLPKSSQEIDLRTSDRSYFVKFYLAGDALTQSGQFLAARAHFDNTNKHPREYLDVRVIGKVFYK